MSSYSLGRHTYLAMGINLRLTESRFGMEEYNMCKVWEQTCDSESDADTLCVQIREFSEWQDMCQGTAIEKGENKWIIAFLWTNITLIICITLY